jgi:hypothetical protein
MEGGDIMVSILDILKYFGYKNPEEAYKQLPMDVLRDYIRKYYEITNRN